MRCSRSFRALVVARLPALTRHPDGHAYFKMLQYILWSTMTDKDSGKLLLPYETLADIVGMNAKNKRYRASAWIEAFSEDVFPLNTTEYRYVDRKARSISPVVPTDIVAAHRADAQAEDRKDWVWFTDGSRVSRRRLRETIQEEEAAIIGIARAAGKDHPAGELMDYLLTQPQDCLQRVLTRNWPRVKEAVFALPRDTPKQVATSDWCDRVVNNLHERRTIYYGAARKSPRLYAIGSTIHLLPKRLRQLALAGGVELDLKAAQLAIVSQLWDVPSLREFLADRNHDIWGELLGSMTTPMERKPVLKVSVYGIVFGMGASKAQETLAVGTDKDKGVGEVGAAQFFSHPLVHDLLAARSRVLQRIRVQRGAEDAFGRWVATDWDRKSKTWNVPSVAAQVVQSWEVRLMLSLVPVLRAERQLYCLSFLHDGLTVWCGDETKRERHLRKLQEAVQGEAAQWGFPTWLARGDEDTGGEALGSPSSGLSSSFL